MSSRIVIINYGLGNLASIQNIIKKIGFTSQISSDAKVIARASKIILPGVGAFDEGIRNIEAYDLKSVLIQKAKIEKTPILGICLGMHLLTERSEEGVLKGLSIVEATTRRFPTVVGDEKLRIPHIGWNYVRADQRSKLTQGFDETFRFYFVHSYFVELKNAGQGILHSKYGVDFVAGFETENIVGVQFHPEKSHKYGKKLLENFLLNY